MKPGEKNVQYNKTNNTQLRGWQSRLLTLKMSLSTQASTRLTMNFSGQQSSLPPSQMCFAASVDNEFLGVTICSTTLSAVLFIVSSKAKTYQVSINGSTPVDIMYNVFLNIGTIHPKILQCYNLCSHLRYILNVD